MKARCANCKTVMFECSSDYLCEDFECMKCGAVNQFDNSNVPTKVVLPRHLGAIPMSRDSDPHTS
jgi:phage FluMu protein Com